MTPNNPLLAQLARDAAELLESLPEIPARAHVGIDLSSVLEVNVHGIGTALMAELIADHPEGKVQADAYGNPVYLTLDGETVELTYFL